MGINLSREKKRLKKQRKKRDNAWERLREARRLGASKSTIKRRKKRKDKWANKVRQTVDKIEAAKKEAAAPKFIRLDAPMENLFGALGPFKGYVGHYTAGVRDKTDAEAKLLFESYNAQHRRQGWGAIGYHIGITSAGSIVLLRPTAWKGAHTAGENTGRLGIVVCGTTGDTATEAQKRSLRWLHENMHTSAMPATHRAPAPLNTGSAMVHKELGPTACPGDFTPFYKNRGR